MIVTRLGSRQVVTATSCALLQIFLLFYTSIHVVRGNLLPNPIPKWSVQLQGSGPLSGRGLRKGNAIVAYKDGTKIAVTANDGSLHIIQTTNQVKTLAVHVPEEKIGTTMECRSGAAIVYTNEQDGLYFPIDRKEDSISAKEDFIVYAVFDNTLPLGTGIARNLNDGTTSRVFAVNMNGDLKWSVNVLGRIEGTPLVGKKGIYVTHNFNSFGTLSIIRIQLDGTGTIAGTARRKTIPFGPPTLRTPYFWEDESSITEDIVVVAEMWEAGFSESNGGLYMLSSSSSTTTKDKDKDKEKNKFTSSGEQYDLISISSWSYSASAPPLVNGESIFLGAAGGTIAGFTGNKKNDLSGVTPGKEAEISPRWDYRLAPNPQNSSQPIQSQPVLDSQGQYLCVSGVNNDFYCLESEYGTQLWRAQEGSQILARPHIFEGTDWKKVVYTIETNNGRVRQYDLYSGRRYWDYSCADISNKRCQNAVEAEFALSPSGNTIYYGDIYGRINSLEVGNFVTESPSTTPSSIPTVSPTGLPTLTPAPTGVAVPTQMPQLVETSEPSASIIIINDGIIDQQSEDGGSIDNNSGTNLVADSTTSSNTETSAISGSQATKGDSNMTSTYIGAAIAGLCVLMIPIVIFSMLRRKRKKSTSIKDVAVEIIDDCSSDDDIESQDYLKHIETNNSYDPNNGDSIEVEIIDHVTSRRNQSKQKKKSKMKKGKLPVTPDTINSLESIEEIHDDSNAKIVVGKKYDVTDPPVEAVDLRQSFDQVSNSRMISKKKSQGAGSNKQEYPTGNENIVHVSDSSPFGNVSDDDVPPPPPLEEESPSSKEWTWGSLLQIGTSQSPQQTNISPKKSSEKIELRQSTNETPSSQMELSMTVSEKVTHTDEQPSQEKQPVVPVKRNKWRKNSKKNLSPPSLESEMDITGNNHSEIPTSMNQKNELEPSVSIQDSTESVPKDAIVDGSTSEEVDRLIEDVEEEPVKLEDKIGTQSSFSSPQTPVSPSMSMISDTAQSLSPVRSVLSIQESSISSQNHSSLKSIGSDDDSLYTSFTGTIGVAPEKKQDVKEMSPLLNYLYDQDIHRRGRSEIVNEGKSFLAQPVLSKSNVGIGEEEHPDDEIAVTPGNQHLVDKMEGPKYGRSVRSKRDPDSFISSNSGPTPIAEMYEQLAAIGKQRREEKKPAFKRRNKRMDQENLNPPPNQPNQEGDTWGSFLNELEQAEKQFFSPSGSKSKTLLKNRGPEGIEDAK